LKEQKKHVPPAIDLQATWLKTIQQKTGLLRADIKLSIQLLSNNAKVLVTTKIPRFTCFV
jgi:hypothetical protein